MRSMLLQCWIHIFGYSDDIPNLQQGSDHRQLLQAIPKHRIPFIVANPSVTALKFEDVSAYLTIYHTIVIDNIVFY